MILQFSATVTSLPVNIDIVDDLVFESTERFNISLSTTSDGCVISPGNEIIPVYILDDGETLCACTLHMHTSHSYLITYLCFRTISRVG